MCSALGKKIWLLKNETSYTCTTIRQVAEPDWLLKIGCNKDEKKICFVFSMVAEPFRETKREGDTKLWSLYQTIDDLS
jgi:hypothetical protein